MGIGYGLRIVLHGYAGILVCAMIVIRGMSMSKPSDLMIVPKLSLAAAKTGPVVMCSPLL
ncbi:MAG TPA: hypothetical protein DD666_08310 [Advenella kashmirensis]|uniref:Uncharacterized protein n=1 Tax=Advenella kashmirensis TaxID=310575 RepID=A0A356LEQ3_9BURK|nr:hypothetical protein [Advenella kashmirensis]